jgi:hypothetical protein
MIVRNKNERIWRIEVQFCCLPGWTEENREELRCFGQNRNQAYPECTLDELPLERV